MNEQKIEQDKDIITRLALIIGVIGGFLGGLIIKGALRKDTWTFYRLRAWFFYGMTVAFFVMARIL